MTRCELLAFAASSTLLRARETTASPVSIDRDASYDEDLPAVPAAMFDQLGGGSGRVANETVPIKLNLTRSLGLKLGSNGVATHPVAKVVMGYDPRADRGVPPFRRCVNTLKLAEAIGAGFADLKRIEVRGVSIYAARYAFEAR